MLAKKTLLACCATCGSSTSRRRLRYRGECSPLARVNAGVHGEGKAKKSRRDGGGEVGDGARAGVRLETDGHPWSARLPSCAPCLCVREGRRSFGTRLNRSHSPRHGRLRGQQAAGRPHQWHGHAGCTWQHCVTNGGGCPAAVSMRPPKEHAGRPRTCSARR